MGETPDASPERTRAFDSGSTWTRPAVASRRIAVVDDHRLLAQMLVDQLAAEGHEAFNIDVLDDRLEERVVELDLDLLILDAVFNDDEEGGMRVLDSTVAASVDFPVVILTGVTGQERHAEFLDRGAAAVVSKGDSFDSVVAQINELLQGLDPMGATRRAELAALLADHRRRAAANADVLGGLTASERATLQGLVDGRTVDEMSVDRTVAVSTVRSHVRSILRKLGAHSQVEAIAIAARAGIRPVDPSGQP